jgi:hypothetical protein
MALTSAALTAAEVSPALAVELLLLLVDLRFPLEGAGGGAWVSEGTEFLAAPFEADPVFVLAELLFLLFLLVMYLSAFLCNV